VQPGRSLETNPHRVAASILSTTSGMPFRHRGGYLAPRITAKAAYRSHASHCSNSTHPKKAHMRTSPFTLAAAAALACGSASAAWESSILPSDFAMESSLERATSRAAKEGKAVVVYYTRTRCPPCDILQSRLKVEEIAGRYRENYVFTAVWGTSMNAGERQHYRAAYDVQGAPTWIFFSGEGKYLCTSSGGFRSTDQSIRLHAAVQALLQQPRPDSDPAPRACR
jgi:hypothetical protein